jgi:hypothetical protein
MLHGISPNKLNNVQIVVNGTEIQKVSKCRYLGIIIDDELKWTDHCQYVYNKLVRFISIFYKLRSKLPVTVLMNIYYAFVHSHLLYAIEVYANTCHTYLDSLVKLNNKILRILQNKPARFPVVELYQAYKTLPIPQLHELRLLILAAKILHHPEKLPNIFKIIWLLMM